MEFQNVSTCTWSIGKGNPQTLSINLVISMYKFDKVCLSNKLFYSINIKKEICYCRSVSIPWSVFN